MAKQSRTQRGIVGRVMHEFKDGDLESSSGQEVTNPRQAIAIALHEAGASRDETPAGSRRSLGRTKARDAQASAGRKAGGSERANQDDAGTGSQTRAALYEEAKERGVPGRSRMTRDELARALGRSRKP